MIPKTIHYCWFGHNPLPDLAVKCIASWRKFLPDYEIWEWNEDGSAPQTRALADKYMRFDVNVIPYTAEAYSAKKYAFLSDYARFWILYNYGGLYFDTDVEVLKNMDAILSAGPFMACETNGSDTTPATINPGLGIYASSNNSIYEEILNMYSKMHFLKEDGTHNMTIVVYYITKLLSKYGLGKIDKKTKLAGMTIYPKDYFCPKDYSTRGVTITPNTVCIHHFDGSWLPESERRKHRLKELIGPTISGLYTKIHLYLMDWFSKK